MNIMVNKKEVQSTFQWNLQSRLSFSQRQKLEQCKGSKDGSHDSHYQVHAMC